MNQEDMIKSLEARIKLLEERLDKILLWDVNEVTLAHCSIGEIKYDKASTVSFNHCPVGYIIDKDIDDAESRMDELEGRLDDINSRIDESESRCDSLE